MRIRTVGVIAVLGLALAASGCGTTDEPTATPSKDKGNGKLVIWADQKRTAALKPFADQFGKENGVTVEVKEISENQQQTFLTASQQGSGPDVMVGAHDWIGNLVQNGAIDPVQLTAAQKASFPEIALKAVSFNGQTYGAPYAIENVALIRNTELVPTAPATLDDAIKAGKELKAAKKVSEIMCLPIGQQGDAYHIYPIYSAAGGSLFGTTATGDPDPKNVTVGSAESVAAWTKLKELGEKGETALKTSISNDNAIATFAAKKCAFLVSGPWSLVDIKKTDIKYDIQAVPGFAGGKAATPFVGVQSFFVASKGKSKALAQEFVANYVTNKDVALALYNADPRPPALTAALDQVKGTDPDAGKFLEAGKGGFPMPAIPEMSAIWGPFGNAEAAVTKGGDPATAAAAAAKAIVDAIAKK
ncbi:arabinogalactan oligomer/maltooligosaccharide transport system substrate-binding protein [Allocatelliglobosispora scoriae]|uniref:Arabinogalactan oligomer/maltooligosaccharide transport system substrate-binding protein n=1 Tax=Allocatelliglobosispora scoriae TaxID=643052 RepID=A0A841BUK6_9ACTN|nr:maltose ABC transporter substrate-binding protein [Allocatelliglobosispora scoriae]MBB5870431.1 arabinogalactan oligomer/maltooligosaccharide transport system substrate-binding protein [Allocatelliglobosispora scoriae]